MDVLTKPHLTQAHEASKAKAGSANSQRPGSRDTAPDLPPRCAKRFHRATSMAWRGLSQWFHGLGIARAMPLQGLGSDKR